MSVAHLDAASAPRLDPRVVSAMAPFVGADPSSPSGVHALARPPAEAIEAARGAVRALLGAADEDAVVFTASATEARNLAVLGLTRGARERGDTLVLSAIEHPAVEEAAIALERDGARVRRVPVDAEGRIDPESVAREVDERTSLVSVHHGHQDVGTVQDVAAIVAASKAANPEARVHVDAGASAGLVPIDVESIGCDAVSVGGPPLGAPPWSGALYVRPGSRLYPVVPGGTQELGKRAGPECVPAIAALGAAADIALLEGAERAARLRRVADRLLERLLAVPDVRRNGPESGRVPGRVHVSVRGVDGETLAASLGARGVAVAPGSACTQHAGKESPVLLAMGSSPEWARAAILLSADAAITDSEVDRAAIAFTEEVARLRALAEGLGAGP